MTVQSTGMFGTRHPASRLVTVLALVVAASLSPAPAADKEVQGPVLIRVERASSDDLSRLLSAGVPVVLEMRDCLFVEGTLDHVRWLDDRGYASSILDSGPASSDYLVVGLRPDSSMEAVRATGTVLHREDNWVLVRVDRGASVEDLALEKVFVTRMPHEPLHVPKGVERKASPAGVDFAEPDPLVQAIVDQVQTTSIDQLWVDLTSNPPTGTRLSTHQGCQDAAAYCHDLYETLGIPVEYQLWSASHAPNVIATQTGALRPDDVYIVIGHLDDLPVTPPAPGADDNASGSALVLESARAMSCHVFESTVKYLNVTGEESGLLGSDAYTDDAFARGERILGVINMDMPGWEGDGSPDPENVDINYNSNSAWLGLLFAECAQRYGTGLVVDAFFCPSLTASDHYPFWQRGWSAICGITDNEGYCGHGGNYPYYHGSNDTIANCGDPTFFYSVVKTSVATLAEMARPFKILTDRPSYACGSGIGVLVGDRDLDTDPGAPEGVVVEAWSATEPTPEAITLDERSASSAVFEGVVPTSLGPPVTGDGLVGIAPGDVVTVRYVDALDCDGATGVSYTAAAPIDCTAPVITNVAATGVTGAQATITWNTSEPADSLVTYGEVVPGTTAASGALVTSHSVTLQSLDDCAVYRFSVTSTDAAGNPSTDDNQGAFHTFATPVNNTPEYPSTDTPRPIVDNTTFTSPITVTDTETVLDVEVRLNITHTFDGDVDVFLIGPEGTRVELTTDNGGNGDNFTGTIFDDEAATAITAGIAPFAGRFRPEGSLATLDGLPSAGTWTLEVTDDANTDIGQLASWSLILTVAAQPCGPLAVYESHHIETDACPTGASGLGNGLWEAGEQVEFRLTVLNDGTAPVTGAAAHVTPLTAGVTMLDDAAAVGNLAPGATGDTQGPNLIARLAPTLTCGQMVDFDVTITSAEGSWPATFQQQVGELIAAHSEIVLSESFASGLPATWSVTDGFGDGETWFADSAADPSGCASPDPAVPPFAGSWAAVDSACTGGGTRMDEALITPVLDFTDDPIVTLQFDHWFAWASARRDEVADVDVRSSATGGQWVNVGRWTGASTPNAQHVVLDISAQAGNAPDVQIRWRYYEAQVELYWYVDNVVVDFFAPEICNMATCAAAASSPPPIPGTMLAERMTPDGSEIAVAWDDQCAPASAKILYGPLAQVASYTIGGAVCGISNPAAWNAVPAGDLWWVVVSDDGAGVESSWGPASDGERNGLTDSGTCGSTTKDLTGSCP